MFVSKLKIGRQTFYACVVAEAHSSQNATTSYAGPENTLLANRSVFPSSCKAVGECPWWRGAFRSIRCTWWSIFHCRRVLEAQVNHHWIRRRHPLVATSYPATNT